MFSVRLKAMVVAFFLIVVTGGAAVGYSVVHVKNVYLEESLSKGKLILDLLVYSIADPLYKLEISEIKKSLGNVLVNDEVILSYVADQEFYILSDGTDENLLRDELLPDIIEMDFEQLKNKGFVVSEDISSVYFFEEISLVDSEVSGYVLLNVSLREMEASLQAMYRAYGVIMASLAFLGLILSAVLTGFLTRPLDMLGKVTREIARGDFLVRAKYDGNDELGKLSGAINYMAQQLEHTTVTKEYVSNVADAMSDGLFVLGLNDLVVQVNKTFLCMIGGEECDVLGSSVEKYFDGTKISVTMGVQSQERNIINSQGQKGFSVRIKPSPMLDEKGNLSAFVYVVIDMSEELERSKLLMEAKRNAEEMLMVKSAFMAKVSHELRTPLNAILGFTQRVIKSPESQLSKRNKEGLEQVLASSHTLLSLIDNMLDLNRIESEGGANLQTTDLAVLLKADFETMRVKAEQKGLSAELIAPDSYVGIVTNVGIVNDVLNRLFDNAMKFTKQGGITVRLSLSDDESSAVISVKDTGIGILEENMEKIFSEFNHLQENIDGKGAGLGVGLSIVKKELALLKGGIDVESKWGEGTCFTVTLPRGNEVLLNE